MDLDHGSTDIEEWNKDCFVENCSTIDHSADSKIEYLTDQD